MKMQKRAVRSENGFTLLEMTVAVTLVAMMALGVWSVFRTSIRSWSRGMENIDAGQRHRNILDMVRKQIASAYPLSEAPDPEIGGIPNPIFDGTETGVRFISLNSLQFHNSPGLTIVNYEVIQDSQGGYSLVESEERYLGQTSETEDTVSPSRNIPLFENLTNCYFEFLNAEGEADTDQWVRDWNAQEQGKLPDAISMTMTSMDTDGVERNRRVVVPLHATEASIQMNILNRGVLQRGIEGGAGIRVPGSRIGSSAGVRGPGGEMEPGRGRGGSGRGRRPGRTGEPGRGLRPGPGNIPWSDLPPMD